MFLGLTLGSALPGAVGTEARVNVCTIIAKNYVAQARILARSFAEHHPHGRFWTLVIDDYAGYLDPTQEPFEVLTPSEIGCDAFDAMAARYSVLELSTAVKPWLLRHLLDATSDAVTYLDPDIRIYSPLHALDELARAHRLVLIPHNTHPIPPDGERPSQIDIMIAGVYNLGYISLAPEPEVERLLDWWSDRLLRDCRVDPTYGYFVDQRWFDLAPGFLSDYAIVREPQYNVAYWNLHSRQLDHDGERYLVDGKPLAFFHFSGFDPDDRAALSRHQTRIQLSQHPAVERICGEYADAARAEGYPTARDWPYTYAALADGTPYDKLVQSLYLAAQEQGHLTESPFTSAGTEAFLHWLGEQADGAPPGINRLLAHLYGTRRDLQRTFPELEGADRQRLLAWARGIGAQEVPLLARLAELDPESERQAAERETAPPGTQGEEPLGVNVVGYFRSELGVGEAARQVVRALDAVQVPLIPIHGPSVPASRQGHSFTHLSTADARFPINLICMNADMLPEFAEQVGEEFFFRRRSVGLWFWEVASFRDEWKPAFDVLDQVWVPTEHVAKAVSPVSPIPVAKVTIPVEVPAIVPRTRAELGLPEGFVFLFSFDYRSVFERKNPLGVVDAFKRAFAPGDGAKLVIKCINGEVDPAAQARLGEAIDGHRDVHVLDRYLSPVEKDTLTASCDSYVSLHRAEGFGLPMAEAMHLAKPVIATGYSGNLDFMTAENSYLVDYRLVPVGENAPPYPPDSEWAEPNVDHAAELMRHVFEDRREATVRGELAARDLRRTHSPPAAGLLMLERLRSLSIDSTNGASVRVSGALPELLQRGPAPARRSKAGLVGRAGRRGVLRLMRPYTAYQDSVNAQILGALQLLDGREQANTRLHATVLAKLREDALNLGRLPLVVAALSKSGDAAKASLFELGRQLTEINQQLFEVREHLARQGSDRGFYLAVAELRRRYRAGGQPVDGADSLTASELKAFSQNGEDGVIAEVLRRIGTGERFFVEFGIEDGREGNGVYLADVEAWRGLFIEADPRFHSRLQEKYSGNPRISTMESTVTPDNVERLFCDAGVPSEPDVLSIDVDGNDYWIWEAIENYRARLVVIEYNSSLDPARRLVQPRDDEATWDGTEYHGASLGALRSLGERKGYRLVHTELAGVNAFFVREDLAGARLPDPDSVPARAPNYFLAGGGHPPDPQQRRYVDLDADTLVSVKQGFEAPTDGGPSSSDPGTAESDGAERSSGT